MSCILSNGQARDCSDSLGGIVEVLISERDNVTATTLASGDISAITQSGATNFYRYELKKESGSLTSTATVDQAGGTSFYEGLMSACAAWDVSPILLGASA